jgi:hypothetical protein
VVFVRDLFVGWEVSKHPVANDDSGLKTATYFELNFF